MYQVVTCPLKSFKRIKDQMPPVHELNCLLQQKDAIKKQPTNQPTNKRVMETNKMQSPPSISTTTTRKTIRMTTKTTLALLNSQNIMNLVQFQFFTAICFLFSLRFRLGFQPGEPMRCRRWYAGREHIPSYFSQPQKKVERNCW